MVAEQLAIDHPGNTAERDPIRQRRAAKRPNQPVERQAVGDMRVAADQPIVVIVQKLVTGALAEDEPRHQQQQSANRQIAAGHSTVTLLARFRGLSMSQPRGHRDMVGQKLQRDHHHDRLQELLDGRDLDDVVGQLGRLLSPSPTTAITGPPRALISWRLAITLSYTWPCGMRKTLGVCSSTSAIGPVLHLGRRIALRMDVADLLEFQRALPGRWEN